MNDVSIPINIYIRRNSDMLVMHYDAPDIVGFIDDGSFNEFIWSDGNFACDCNRRLFFERALDANYDDDIDYDCGSDKYAVRITDKSDNVLYDEFELKLSEE